MTENRSRAAALIAAARLARTPLARLGGACRPGDEAEGYAVQDLVHARLVAAGGGRRVGYKIGCTTPVMQAMLEIDHPCAGGVLAGAVHERRATIAGAQLVRPGVECEIALRLGRDLAAADAPHCAETVADAVDACMAAIEIVEDRYRDHRALGVPTLLADDFFGFGCVLGRPVTAWRPFDLATLRATTHIDGQVVGEGVAGDVMGHPFEALAWLANRWAERGRGLERGALVLTGSIVAVAWLDGAAEIRATVEGLGEAWLRVT